MSVSAYSCLSVHCYSKTRWAGYARGSYTAIYIVHISDSDVAGNRIDNETWLLDPNGPGQCNGLCWVEAGYTFVSGGNFSGGQGYERLFYAEQNPVSGFSELVDFTALYPGIYPGDYYGMAGIAIRQDATQSYFYTTIQTPTGSYGHYSSNQFNPSVNGGYTFNANFIDSGQELSGQNGGYSDPASWNSNIWIAPDYNGYYQTTPVDQYNPGNSSDVNNPPTNGYWSTYPGQPNSYGGTRVTYTCC